MSHAVSIVYRCTGPPRSTCPPSRGRVPCRSRSSRTCGSTPRPRRPQFTFDEAISFQITCETQDEVDDYWQRLTDGGEEGPCGWLKDRYGLSWQVVPAGMEEMLDDADPQRAERVMQAVLQMRKIDLAAMRRAADGPAVG